MKNNNGLSWEEYGLGWEEQFQILWFMDERYPVIFQKKNYYFIYESDKNKNFYKLLFEFYQQDQQNQNQHDVTAQKNNYHINLNMHKDFLENNFYNSNCVYFLEKHSFIENYYEINMNKYAKGLSDKKLFNFVQIPTNSMVASDSSVITDYENQFFDTRGDDTNLETWLDSWHYELSRLFFFFFIPFFFYSLLEFFIFFILFYNIFNWGQVFEIFKIKLNFIDNLSDTYFIWIPQYDIFHLNVSLSFCTLNLYCATFIIWWTFFPYYIYRDFIKIKLDEEDCEGFDEGDEIVFDDDDLEMDFLDTPGYDSDLAYEEDENYIIVLFPFYLFYLNLNVLIFTFFCTLIDDIEGSFVALINIAGSIILNFFNNLIDKLFNCFYFTASDYNFVNLPIDFVLLGYIFISFNIMYFIFRSSLIFENLPQFSRLVKRYDTFCVKMYLNSVKVKNLISGVYFSKIYRYLPEPILPLLQDRPSLQVFLYAIIWLFKKICAIAFIIVLSIEVSSLINYCYLSLIIYFKKLAFLNLLIQNLNAYCYFLSNLLIGLLQLQILSIFLMPYHFYQICFLFIYKLYVLLIFIGVNLISICLYPYKILGITNLVYYIFMQLCVVVNLIIQYIWSVDYKLDYQINFQIVKLYLYYLFLNIYYIFLIILEIIYNFSLKFDIIKNWPMNFFMTDLTMAKYVKSIKYNINNNDFLSIVSSIVHSINNIGLAIYNQIAIIVYMFLEDVFFILSLFFFTNFFIWLFFKRSFEYNFFQWNKSMVSNNKKINSKLSLIPFTLKPLKSDDLDDSDSLLYFNTPMEMRRFRIALRLDNRKNERFKYNKLSKFYNSTDTKRLLIFLFLRDLYSKVPTTGLYQSKTLLHFLMYDFMLPFSLTHGYFYKFNQQKGLNIINQANAHAREILVYKKKYGSNSDLFNLEDHTMPTYLYLESEFIFICFIIYILYENDQINNKKK